MSESKKKFCHNCKKATGFYRPKKVNHILHAVLSLITFGFWLIVWLVLWLMDRDSESECIECGTTH